MTLFGEADLKVDAISTERLDLVAMTPRFLECTCDGRCEEAEAVLAMRVPPLWFECGSFAALRLRQLRDGVTSLPRLPRAISFKGSREMVGYIGFHTSPAPKYLKEIVTVNSSPNSEGVYVHFGFRRTSDERIKNGVRFIPMAFERKRLRSTSRG